MCKEDFLTWINTTFALAKDQRKFGQYGVGHIKSDQKPASFIVEMFNYSNWRRTSIGELTGNLYRLLSCFAQQQCGLCKVTATANRVKYFNLININSTVNTEQLVLKRD